MSNERREKRAYNKQHNQHCARSSQRIVAENAHEQYQYAINTYID